MNLLPSPVGEGGGDENIYGSHALRGNPAKDAPASRTAERFRLHSHAERGNDEPRFQEVITDHILSSRTAVGVSTIYARFWQSFHWDLAHC